MISLENSDVLILEVIFFRLHLVHPLADDLLITVTQKYNAAMEAKVKPKDT